MVIILCWISVFAGMTVGSYFVMQCSVCDASVYNTVCIDSSTENIIQEGDYMNEPKESRFGKYMKYIRITFVFLLILCAFYIAFVVAAWEQRREAHADIKKNPDAHDAFINLTCCGNKSSVPILIDALDWAVKQWGSFNEDEPTICTWGHCKDALKSLTGEDFGFDNVAWRNWWDTLGKDLPKEHFKPRKTL
jgi:hypothetical protein